MNPIRYIITRSCLQDGSMRLLKYNESSFASAGPAQFIDEQGREFAVQIDRERMRVTGLGRFYHDHNLGVNDVMVITPIASASGAGGRYEVANIVKPHAAPTPAQAHAAPIVTRQPEPQRVVVASTPHVREVRIQRPVVTLAAGGATGFSTGATPAATPTAPKERDEQREGPQSQAISRETAREVAAIFAEKDRAVAPAAPQRIEDVMGDFARLTGYRLSHPAPGLMRLQADLGEHHGYSVLLAADALAMAQPTWDDSQDESKLLLTLEAEHAEDVSRVTREALSALMEHARLAPIGPVDLRGYWRAGNLDLNAAGNIAELVSAHLAQRGALSYVLLTLANHDANSIVSAPQLATQLGSGVNTAELSSILDTLSRPPFMALTPLGRGEYLLRQNMNDMLADVADYAQSVRRRMRTPEPVQAMSGQNVRAQAEAVLV